MPSKRFEKERRQSVKRLSKNPVGVEELNAIGDRYNREKKYRKLVDTVRMWRDEIKACNMSDDWKDEIEKSEALLRELGEIP